MGWQYRMQYAWNKAHGIPNHPPCANCGKIDGGFMYSTEWGHDYKCCSKRCGQRLAQRIKNGMFPRNPEPNLEDDRERLFRYRIKHLKKQLKLAGIKPKGNINLFKKE